MDGVADVDAFAATRFRFWGMGEPREESARGRPLALPRLFFVEAPHSSSSCGELASGDDSTRMAVRTRVLAALRSITSSIVPSSSAFPAREHQ